MTVQELINELNAIEDKSKDVFISVDISDETHPLRRAYADEVIEVIFNDPSCVPIICEGRTNSGSSDWDFEDK